MTREAAQPLSPDAARHWQHRHLHSCVRLSVLIGGLRLTSSLSAPGSPRNHHGHPTETLPVLLRTQGPGSPPFSHGWLLCYKYLKRFRFTDNRCLLPRSGVTEECTLRKEQLPFKENPTGVAGSLASVLTTSGRRPAPKDGCHITHT